MTLERPAHLLRYYQAMDVPRAKSWVCGLLHFSVLGIAASLVKIVLRE